MSGSFSDLLGDDAEPERQNAAKDYRGPEPGSPEFDECKARRCWWNVGLEHWDTHKPGCPYSPRRKQVEAAPKSRRIGRITDHDTARKEIESMARVAGDDPRFTPCMAFVYGHLANRGFKHGSVFVMAGRDWLSRWSDGRFSEKECRTALDRLEQLGYVSQVPWSRVKKRDPGLFDYAKRRNGGAGGRWANAYLLRQDFPERDVIPDDQNPILELMGLSA